MKFNRKIFPDTKPNRNFITKKLMEMSIFTCEMLIVDSYFARDQIANILKLNKDKIQVIYLGIDNKYLSLKKSKNFLSTLDYFGIYLGIYIFEISSFFLNRKISIWLECHPTYSIPIHVPHVAERFGLFIMLILGESLVISTEWIGCGWRTFQEDPNPR